MSPIQKFEIYGLGHSNINFDIWEKKCPKYVIIEYVHYYGYGAVVELNVTELERGRSWIVHF